MIEKSDIEKLTTLARISVSDEEKERLQKDIGAILGYVDSLQGVSGDEMSEQDRAHTDVRTVMRDDQDPHEPGLYIEALLALAPKTEKGFYKVKKILGGSSE